MTGSNGEKSFSLYIHTFPNGKKYVGISSDPVRRWANGRGYQTQPKVYNAIKKYGWDAISHEIVVSGLSKSQAEYAEYFMISALGTVNNGYNSAVGGENIITTYLSPEVLDMLRQSKRLDRRYGGVSQTSDITQTADRAKNDPSLANVINRAGEYARHRIGAGWPSQDFTVDAYWYYVAEYMRMENDPEHEVISYPQAVYNFYFQNKK